MQQYLQPAAPDGPSVEQLASQTIYYRQAWLDLIAKLYGCAIITLSTTDAQGRVTGSLPVCVLDSPLRGRRLVALPFSDHCPLVAINDASAKYLIDQAIALARQERARYLELRTGAHPVLSGRADLVEGNLYVRWLMQLDPMPNAVWRGLRKPIQHQVEKARKRGVRVRIARSSEDLAQYYRLHLQTRTRKHGMPTQPRGFFEGLWEAFAPDGSMQTLLAEYEGTVIAGMVLLAAGDTLRYAYGASNPDSLQLAPNNLLMWEAMSWACTNGYRVLDLGRTARDNAGLMEFKRRWGATLEPLPYYYFPAVGGLAATSERSWRYRCVTACWRRLPLPVAELLGGHLYKHLG
jgi:FemAB-related protein (PEP-CTERM system-associated)